MSVINRYGLIWKNQDDLQIEFDCIRRGGKWKMQNGKEYGEGLFKHYRNAQSLLWPDDDHHIWSDLILKTIVDNRLTVVQGSRDSGKTRTMSKYALADYWCFPTQTLILMSSTDIRGLELRVWGDIKDLFDRGRERYPWLSGNVVDAKHGVFTDTLGDDGEVRDMRRGIICIPCLGSDGQWAGGLEKFVGIKQKRRRLLGDECFPAGTMVDTPSGAFPIETIETGEIVFNACGTGTVIATKCSFAVNLVTVSFSDGRKLTCTPGHMFLTLQQGWVEASQLTNKHYVYGTTDSLLLLRKEIDGKPYEILRQCLLHEMEEKSREGGVLQQEAFGGACKESTMGKGHSGDNEKQAKGFGSSGSGENKQDASGNAMEAPRPWREWPWTDSTREEVIADGSDGSPQLLHQNEGQAWKWDSDTLQNRRGYSSVENSYRSGREFAQFIQSKGGRPKEGFFLTGAWVDRVEIQESADHESGSGGNCSRGHRVYNLQVSGHPSYSVNGLLVHNCQFMHVNYINTLSNLDKGDFKGGFVGNPIGGNGKALDKLAEPVGGWDTLGEITKTTTWKNKYDGVTINLVGIDSPNFDADRPKDYPYLVDQSDVDRVMKRSGKDSAEFWSQIMGVRKIGVDAYRVLTRSMCLKFGAFDSCIWASEATTKVLGIDAGFGGDPCECIMIEFGKDVLGQTVVKFNPTITIPIQVTATDTAEDQIAVFVKSLIQDLNVPPGHVGFEAGMRATLAISMARIVSNEVNAVNVGGPATDRPVNNEMYIFDEITKGRRLKRCNEHYSKFITEMWFAIQQVVKSRQARELPEDVMNEFAMREWRFVANNRYELETKQECKERMGSSPNKADATSVAMEIARRLGFEIESMKADGDPIAQDDWMAKELQKQRQQQKKHELNYRT